MPTSAIVKTEAITLRVAPFSNTSHVVTWLTPTHGKIATVVKGACRPKSPVLGQYDIGFLCELLFYERDRNGLHILKECSVLDSRRQIRGDWQRTAAASYMCHLASIVTPDAGHAPELYTLLAASLCFLTPDMVASHSMSLLLFWLELQLLSILGIPPQLDKCVNCHASAAAGTGTTFSPQQGGVVCAKCKASGQSALAGQSVTNDVLAILRRLQRTPRFEPLLSLRCTADQQLQMRHNVGSFLEYHTDLAPECRSIAFQMQAAVG